METITTTNGKSVPTARRKPPKAIAAPKAPKPKAVAPILDRKSLLTALRGLKGEKAFGAPKPLVGFRVFYGRAPREGHKGRWDHVFTLVRGKSRKVEAECVTLPAEAAADFLYESQPGVEIEKPAKPAKKAA